MYFLMSDVHGCFDEMMTALNRWRPQKEHLVVLGDLIDRGPDSLLVVQHLMKLKKRYPKNVTVVRGNHDHMFVSWLMNTPYHSLGEFYNQDHNETLVSFYGSVSKFQNASRKQRGQHVIYNYKNELHFLNDLPYYLETDYLLFTHAGYDLDNNNEWKKNTREMMWSRNFPHHPKPTLKKVFFGHTPTPFLHNDDNNFEVWVNKTNDRVCLDGGVAFGGQLNVLRVDNYGKVLDSFAVPSTNQK